VSTAQWRQVDLQTQLQTTRLDAEGADRRCFGIEQSIFAAPHTPGSGYSPTKSPRRTALGLLEKMGLVERKAHPTDGRQINIKLTARGITVRRNAKEATNAWLSRAIAELDRQEQITLFKAGELFKRMAEKS
jgi:hypothetical protein